MGSSKTDFPETFLIKVTSGQEKPSPVLWLGTVCVLSLSVRTRTGLNEINSFFYEHVLVVQCLLRVLHFVPPPEIYRHSLVSPMVCLQTHIFTQQKLCGCVLMCNKAAWMCYLYWGCVTSFANKLRLILQGWFQRWSSIILTLFFPISKVLVQIVYTMQWWPNRNYCCITLSPRGEIEKCGADPDTRQLSSTLTGWSEKEIEKKERELQG